MKKLTQISQYLLGALLILFGSNKFIGFMPLPEMTPEAGALMGALAASGYILPISGIIQIAAGLAAVANKYVAFAMVLLAPVIFNAFMVHLVLDPAGIGGAALILILMTITMIGHKDKYGELLTA